MSKFKVGEEIWIDTFKDIFVITKILNGLFYNLVDSDGHEYKGICEDELHATAHTMLAEIGFEVDGIGDYYCKKGKYKSYVIEVDKEGYLVSNTDYCGYITQPLHEALSQLMREQLHD